MNRTSGKDDSDESARSFGVIQEKSINHSTDENITVVTECLDDSEYLIPDTEDLSKYAHPVPNDSEFQRNSYHEEWEHLFSNVEYMNELRSLGIKGHLRNSRFRSICWRVYLECLSEDQTQWVKETELLRNEYDKILHELQTNPRCDGEDMDLCLNNPLSQSEESPWNQYFQDSELKLTIQQDVSRTFPEIEFFHTAEVQHMMINVLFCYARKFPHISYRQVLQFCALRMAPQIVMVKRSPIPPFHVLGMHELLAPIIFVLHSDQQAYLHASEIELLDLFEPDTRFSISLLLNPNYTEHDAFFLMCQLMEAVEGWYVLNDNVTFKGLINFNLEPFVRDPDSCPGNALGVKLTKIYEQLLRYHDPELFAYLEQLEIAPQIYGIRWLRLLFGREFAMQDLLVIWDAIFANSLSFDLVDYIFTAMLVFIRDLLLSSDYSSCITHLMRYPAVADVHYLIELALHLKNPVQHKRPIGYSAQMLRHVPLVGGRKEIHRAPVYVASSSSVASQKNLEKSESTRPTSLALPSGIPSDSNVKSQHCRATLNPGTEQCLNLASASHSRRSSEPASVIMPTQSECELEGDESPSLLSHDVAKVLMGRDSYGQTASNLSHNMNFLETDKTKAMRPTVKEMVPLVPQNIPSGSQPPSEHTLKKKGKLSIKYKEERLKQLTVQLAEMQAMAEYCGRWMTAHLDKLQACMERQELQHEDDMLLALAGLKRLRDILNGTVSFSQEVIDDEDLMFVCKTSHFVDKGNQKPSGSVQDNQIDDFVVVQEDMCDGRNSNSPSKSLNNQTVISAKSDVTEPPCEPGSRGFGKSIATASRELCKLFLASSPVTEKQS